MKALWKGYITLGQLGIPVRLFSAVQRHTPELHLLHEADGSPVERMLYCRRERREIPYAETVRAAEVSTGTYVTLTPKDLTRGTTQPDKTIDIKQFCEQDCIAPIYYEKPYYVVPSRGGERGYALLRDALVRAKRLAIAQFVLRSEEHIGALSVLGNIILLHQLRYAAEIIPISKLQTRSLPKSQPSELDALGAVINRFAGPFYIEDYHDEHAESLSLLINRKAQGLPLPRAERVDATATSEDDILSTLQQALQQSHQLSPFNASS